MFETKITQTLVIVYNNIILNNIMISIDNTYDYKPKELKSRSKKSER